MLMVSRGRVTEGNEDKGEESRRGERYGADNGGGIQEAEVRGGARSQRGRKVCIQELRLHGEQERGEYGFLDNVPLQPH